MPKGRPIAVSNVPWHFNVELARVAYVLKPASASGYWNLWPRMGGNAVRTMMPSHEAAKMFPQHAEAILGKPDSSD